MGKYENTFKDIFSVFDSATWKAEAIGTYPNNFAPILNSEYIRVNIIPSNEGINLRSTSGILIIDIFTAAGEGPIRSSVIADKLDSYLQGQTLSTTLGGTTQFSNSSIAPKGVNESLFRAQYTIPFNYFGVF